MYSLNGMNTKLKRKKYENETEEIESWKYKAATRGLLSKTRRNIIETGKI